jgi:hypothetical protein
LGRQQGVLCTIGELKIGTGIDDGRKLIFSSATSKQVGKKFDSGFWEIEDVFNNAKVFVLLLNKNPGQSLKT